MKNFLTHSTEHNFSVIKFLCSLCSHHKGESSISRSNNSATHGRIAVNHLVFLCLLTEFFGCYWGNRRAVYNAGASASRGKDSAVLSENILNILGLWETCDNVVDISAYLLDGGHWLDAHALSLLKSCI